MVSLFISAKYAGLAENQCCLCITQKSAIFLKSKRVDSSYFRNANWLASLEFIVDIVTHLNNLKLQLHSKTQLVIQRYL